VALPECLPSDILYPNLLHRGCVPCSLPCGEVPCHQCCPLITLDVSCNPLFFPHRDFPLIIISLKEIPHGTGL